MNKILLYLYPIEDYIKKSVEARYESLKALKELIDLENNVVERRYRNKGYDVVFLLFPGDDVFGLDKKENDKIIYFDTTTTNPNFNYLFKNIGKIDKLVVTGYHSMDCVRKTAEYAYNLGIDTLVDLELTERFFGLHNMDYFQIDEYNPERYKENVEHITSDTSSFYQDIFNDYYSSPVYGFNAECNKQRQ